MTPDEFDRELDLFYGGANANRVTVYARLPKLPEGGWSLSGAVRGPHCLYSTTLPATLRLADAGPGQTLLAKALMPDPCYWSPELPFLYDVHVELKRGAEVIATADRLLGIRDFGPRGRFFYDQGKRRVIRGAFGPVDPDLLAWHDTPLALVAPSPSDALCEEASRVGVLVVAMEPWPRTPEDEVIACRAKLEKELRRLSRHASVAMIVLDAGGISCGQLDSACHHLAPNNLLGCSIKPLHQSFNVVSVQDIDLAFATVNEPAVFARWFENLDLPILAVRNAGPFTDPSTARLQCDALQAELAPHGDYAGYIV